MRGLERRAVKERFETWLAPQNDERREVAPLRQPGWAFLLAWVFCVFYTNAAGVLSGDAIPNAGEAAASAAPVPTSIGAALFYAVLPLAASVATLAAIVLAEPRIGSPTSHRPLFVVAPRPYGREHSFMFVSVADPGLNALLFGIGAVATGIGSALLWAMWGEYYAVIPRDRSEWLAPVSAVSAAVIVLLVSAMDGWVPVAVAAALRFVRPMLPSRVDARSRPHRRGARNRPSLRNRAALPLGGTRAHGVRHPRRVLHREHRGHDECRAGGRHPPSSHLAVQRAHDGRGSGHGHFGTAPHIPVLPLPLDMPHPGHRICGRHPVRTGRRPCCRGRIAWRPFHLLPDRPDLLRQLRCRRPRDPRPGLQLGVAVRACGRPSGPRFCGSFSNR